MPGHFWLASGSPLLLHNQTWLLLRLFKTLTRAWFGSQRRALDGFPLCLPAPMARIHLYAMWVPRID